MQPTKSNRQRVINEVIRSQRISTQNELLRAIQDMGISTTQASLSRDIAELGIAKEGDHYVLHPSSFYQGEVLNILSIESAGPNMLVIKTAAGSAPLIGVGIDEAKIEGVAGTIAGDDTVFVALSNSRNAGPIKKEIFRRFRQAGIH